MRNLRLCVIGDSHVVAIKQGFDQINGEDHGIFVQFFAAPGNKMRVQSLYMAENILHSRDEEMRKSFRRTSGGFDSIEMDTYDAFLIVGLGFGWSPLHRLSSLYRTVDQNGRSGFRHLISSDCLGEAIEGAVTQSGAVRLIHLLRTATDRAIYLCPQPLPWEEVREPGAASLWNDMVDLGPVLSARFDQASEALARLHKAVVVRQPAETVADGYFTKSSYKLGSTRLVAEGENHGPRDYVHMNAEYGRLLALRIVGMLTGERMRVPGVDA